MKLKTKYYSDAVSVEELKKGCRNFSAVVNNGSSLCSSSNCKVAPVLPAAKANISYYEFQANGHEITTSNKCTNISSVSVF